MAYAIVVYLLIHKVYREQGNVGSSREQNHVTEHVISEVAVMWLQGGDGLTFSSVWSTPVAICDSVSSDSYSVASI